LLEIEHLNVGYERGKIPVLHDITLRVPAGEITSIVGSNGAGKSTLLKAISGLIRPVRGSIRFSGTQIENMGSQDIVKIGLIQIPEGRKIFPEMTVHENLLLGAYARVAKEDRGANLNRVFDLFPVLGNRRKQLARTLSGGEQQMLALGRGLMGSPALLMMDEPSLGLAPIVVKSMFEIMREINAHGVTVLLVEQNVRQALEMAGRAYLLENGRIVLEGSGKEILASEFTKKAYLGI
jgi:branched-chain amino acid transport system ATP-binding protein